MHVISNGHTAFFTLWIYTNQYSIQKKKKKKTDHQQPSSYHQSITFFRSVSIGVTTGKVFCGVVGHPERHEYTGKIPSSTICDPFCQNETLLCTWSKLSFWYIIILYILPFIMVVEILKLDNPKQSYVYLAFEILISMKWRNLLSNF